MISFSKNHYDTFQNSKILGTGYLAYRDVNPLINLYGVCLKKTLDLGCGSGRSTYFLSPLADKLYATDIAQYAIELIKKNITPKAFINNLEDYYTHFPYTSIFSFFTFFHLTNAEEIISEYARCFSSLESGGHLILVNPHENFFHKKYESVACAHQDTPHDGMNFKITLKKNRS